MWVVGKKEEVVGRWFTLDGEVSTGSASVSYRRLQGSTVEYLQSDATTFAAGFHAFSMAFVAGIGWVHQLMVPSSARGFNIVPVKTHASYPLAIQDGEEHYVTDRDEDSVPATVAHPTGKF